MQPTRNKFTSKTKNNFTLSSNKLQSHFKPKSQQLHYRLTPRHQPLTLSQTQQPDPCPSIATNSISTSFQSQKNVTITLIQRSHTHSNSGPGYATHLAELNPWNTHQGRNTFDKKKSPLTRAAGASKIRVNPFHPRHPRCYSCRFWIKDAKHHYH